MSEVLILQLSRSDLDGMIRDAIDSVAKRPVSYVMTKKQLAVYLDQPISTINRWMKQGLPFYKVDETSYPEFYKPQVDKWLEDRFSQIENPVLRRVA